MINPQLLEYVRAQRTAGLSKEAIVQALAQGGWTPQDVNEAFMAIDGVQTPPVPPPAPPRATPGPVTPRVIIPPAQPAAAPMQPGIPPLQPIQPMGMGAQFSTTPTLRPMMAASEVATARVAPKRGHWLLYTIVGIIVLAVLALGAFAYLRPDFFLNMLGLSLPTPTPTLEDTGAQPLVPAESEPINIEPDTEATTTAGTATTTASTTSDVSTTTSPTGTTTSQ